MSSPKSTIYRNLAAFNESTDETVQAILALNSYLDEMTTKIAVASVEEARATTNISVLERLHAEESKDAISFALGRREAALGIGTKTEQPVMANGKATEKAQ